MFNKRKKDLQSPARRRRIDNESEADRSSIVAPAKRFKPGRTLTGSQSAHVTSSNELNAEMISPRAKTHHLVRHRRNIFSRLVMVIALCLALYVLMGQLIATVHVRALVDGTNTPLSDVEKKAYLQTIDEYFARRINERFSPNLNTADLTNYMQASHPEVASLALHQTGSFGESQLELIMRHPVARWIVDGKTEFVNENGMVFSKNYYDEPRVKIIDKNATEVNGGLVASNRFLSFVGQVVGNLEKEGLHVTKATIPTLTTRQLEVSIKGVKPMFKLTVDRSAGEQSEDIARIVRYMKKRELTPSYVDVRVKGKAFYK